MVMKKNEIERLHDTNLNNNQTKEIDNLSRNDHDLCVSCFIGYICETEHGYYECDRCGITYDSDNLI